MPNWPYWWEWNLEFTSYTLRRMRQRGVSETDVRGMLETAAEIRPALESGRWVVACTHGSDPWKVVVELDAVRQIIVIVTVYPVSDLE
jgi:hypothetical protein